MRIFAFFLAFLISFQLFGCTSKNVEIVQNKSSGNRNFTIGEILKMRAFCASSSWAESKNDAGDSVVEYSCKGKLDDAAMESGRKIRLRQIDDFVAQYRSDYAALERKALGNLAEKTTAELDGQLNRLNLAREKLESQNSNCYDIKGVTTNEALESQSKGLRGCDKKQIQYSLAELNERIAATQAGLENLHAVMAQDEEELTEKRRLFEQKKAAYFQKIEAMEVIDRKQVDDLYSRRSEIEQRALFIVHDNEVAIGDYKFFVDGVELSMQRSAMMPRGDGFLFFPSELTAPKSPQSKTEWDAWWSKRIHPELILQSGKFEQSCERNFNCN